MPGLGQAVAVRGDHPGGGAVRLEQHARQMLARLVQRNGEDGLADHVAKDRRVDHEVSRLRDGGELGIVAVGHADHLELDLAAPDLGPVLFRAAHAHLVVRKAFHDLVQLPGRHRQAALFLDLARRATPAC